MASKESTSYKIFVGGLDLETTEEDLTEYFSKYGKVVERLIKVDLKTKKSRGFGFIGFKSAESIDKVLEHNNHRIKGKKIDCKLAMSKEEAYSLNKNLKETCRKIYVSNITKDISKDDLTRYFAEIGPVIGVDLMFKKKETGFCYVIFKNEEDAVKLINRKQIEINGVVLEVKRAIPKDTKDSQDEEEKSKTHPNQQSSNSSNKQRHSFDTSLNYQPYYYPNMPNHYMAVPNRYYPYEQYEYSSGPYPSIQTHNAPPSMRQQDPYERQQHQGQIPPPASREAQGQKRGQSGNYGQYPSSGYQQQHYTVEQTDDVMLLSKQQHRMRVMSDQMINTYKQFPGSSVTIPQGGYPGVPGNQGSNRLPPPRKHYSSTQAAYFQIDGSQQYNSGPSNTHQDNAYAGQAEVNERNTQSKVLGSIEQPGKNANAPQKVEEHFYVNEFTFKQPKFVDGTGKKGAGDQSELNGDRSLNVPAEPTTAEKRTKKSAKIKKIEEEIKQTKDRLKVLEDLLKNEYETVDEKVSDDEIGKSDDEAQNNRK